LTDNDKASSLGLELVPDVRRQSFALDEMITCEACLRANPPTRSNCFYCAANLPQAAKAPAPEAAQEPMSETAGPTNATGGFLLVLTPGQANSPAGASLTDIASELHLRVTDVESVLGLGGAFPLARAVTEEQAKALVAKLSSLGIGAEVFQEGALNLDLPAKRIRALEVSDHSLTALLPSGKGFSVNWDDLILIASGRLLINRIEVEERKRRGRSQPLDSRELFSDEPICDLYIRTDEVGYRISSGSFDFSCLGEQKAMTAFENFTTLVNLLRMRAPNAEVDDSYHSLRAVFGNVWPLEPQTRTGEWRRSGAGKVNVSTVTTIDNEIQFNRYSRLRRYLKSHSLEGDR